MRTCPICALKHVGAAEFFVAEALAGYGHHVAKAFAQMDHAETETQDSLPEVAEVIHQQKKIIGDALEQNNLDLLRNIDFDGLEAMLLAVIGTFQALEYSPSNSKQYNLSPWIERGLAIRVRLGKPVPQEFADKLFPRYDTEPVVEELDELTIHHNGNVNRHADDLDDLGTMRSA